ncbi:hypothetical protein NH26_05275 [Flammeovirga pacifica]|uniref:Uncharacterized protein n=1 Tax=Flammeovirga pacifica TaxID=915059 RepID=A0A1S1YXR7_FLAPC|nr:hypothetical protein NH26_05275 [Flammeovirga pacifica]
MVCGGSFRGEELKSPKACKDRVAIVGKFKNNQNDSVTGKPVTEETKDAAEIGIYCFNFSSYFKYDFDE